MTETRIIIGLTAMFILAGAANGTAQEQDGKRLGLDAESAAGGAIMIAPGERVRRASLVILTPDERVLEATEMKVASNAKLPNIRLADKGLKPVDGIYRYEFRAITPDTVDVTPTKKSQLDNGREPGAKPQRFRTLLASGTFLVRDGKIDLKAAEMKEPTEREEDDENRQ